MSEFCHIYVMARQMDDEWGQPVKVGISRNPQARLATINTASPFRVGIYRSFRVQNRRMAELFERIFHKLNASVRLHGEWFQLTPQEAVECLGYGLTVAYVEDSGRPPSEIQGWYDFIGFPEGVFIDSDGRQWGAGFKGEIP